MNKKSIMLALITLISIFLAACGTSNSEGKASQAAGAKKDEKVLEMATSADFKPFESRNPSGEIQGFDIDLANYIADELGYTLKITDMKFDGLIGALQTNRVDIVLSGMSATEDRKKNVDFSTSYNRSGEMFVTLKDSKIQSIDDLKGKTVGVQLGSIQEEGAKKIQKNIDIKIKTADEGTTLIQELLSNRIDAAYMDKTVAVGYIIAQKLAGFDDPTSSSPGMAVAFPKGSDLVEKVNKVLANAEENGKLQELKDKWLKEEK